MKILITLSSFGQCSNKPLERLKEAGFEIISNPFGRRLTQEESLRLYTPDICAVIAGTEEISRQILEQASSLKVISRCGSDVDNIDLETAKRRNIAVFKTIGLIADAVAELTLGLILNCLRFICAADRMIRNNKWEKPMGYLLRDKTLGIVGMGNIGKRLIELCSGFNLHFIACELNWDNNFAARYNVTFTDLDTLMSQADIISIHLPLTSLTSNLINTDRLKLMKKNAFLINTSRGGIVDEKALYDALKEHRIAGAALDVFNDEPYRGNLTQIDNIILTSHIGSYAREVRVKMELEAVDNLIKGFKKQ